MSVNFVLVSGLFNTVKGVEGMFCVVESEKKFILFSFFFFGSRASRYATYWEILRR